MRKTLREKREETWVEMDNEFIEKYPEGQFVIQRFHNMQGVYWNWCRNTSGVKKHGIGVQGRENSIEVCNYQPCSFGKVTHYTSLDKLVEAANRLNIKPELLELFVNEY